MDSRFPTQYLSDRRIMRMTPEQFRFFVLATAWSVTNMTDGQIDRDDLYLIPFATEDDAQAFVKLGLWIVTDDGWLIADFDKTQTSAAQIEASLLNRRKADAERQKKKYGRDKTKPDPDMDPTDPDQSSRETHVRIEGKERQGKERQGKALDVSSTQTEEDQAVWDSTPSSKDPSACESCTQGRPTEANIKRGIHQCNDCISKQRAAA